MKPRKGNLAGLLLCREKRWHDAKETEATMRSEWLS